MRLDLVGLTPSYINTAAVSFPARNSGGEVLIRVSDAFVILFAELVFFGIRVRVATTPKVFNKIFTFLVRLKGEKGLFLSTRNDVGNVVVQPFFIGVFELGFDVAGLLADVL